MTEQTFPEINGTRLESLAQAVLSKPDACLDGPWSCHPLGGGVGGSLGVYRLAGNACVGTAVWPWSAVLKICAPAAGTAADTWEYPPREALVYRSDLLEALPPGLITPRYYAVEEGPDGTPWMWFEDVVDEHPGQWPPERHAIATAHLGRFNSAYLTSAPLPQHPWLSHLALCDLSKLLALPLLPWNTSPVLMGILSCARFTRRPSWRHSASFGMSVKYFLTP